MTTAASWVIAQSEISATGIGARPAGAGSARQAESASAVSDLLDPHPARVRDLLRQGLVEARESLDGLRGRRVDVDDAAVASTAEIWAADPQLQSQLRVIAGEGERVCGGHPLSRYVPVTERGREHKPVKDVSRRLS
jgi:hypothetical protein